MSQESQKVSPSKSTVRKPSRWKRRLKWFAIVSFLLFLIAAFSVRNHIRTLASLRRVPGTNAYVMDYYVDYNIEEIRTQGLDFQDLEGSYINALMPKFARPIMHRVKRAFLPVEIEPIEESKPAHHCSTFSIKSDQGNVFFGRNFDFGNDACLILRIHDENGFASIAVVDLAYLNLNRSDLDQTSMLERLPLLFTPYYLMDGMNRHGLAVSDMAVPKAEPPVTPGKPSIIQATLMRIILDRAKTVDEAVELVRSYNIRFVAVQEHLMIADAKGNSRIIEYIGGELRITEPKQPWQVCTNHLVWEKSEEENDELCNRYRTGSLAAENLAGHAEFADAQNVVRSMSVENWTMWTSVYDLTRRDVKIFYKAKVDREYRDSIKN